jgi:hypothetical protein
LPDLFEYAMPLPERADFEDRFDDREFEHPFSAVGWALLLRSVQPRGHLVADPRLEASLATPPPDGGPTDAELSGDLLAG